MAEMAQIAIEGGCAWLQLCLGDMSDDEMRLIIPEIAELCRESGTMLTVEDRPDVAKDFGLHGIFLHTGKISPFKVREELGPEAVIGSEIGTPDAATSLSKADIDYVSPAPSSVPELLIAETAACGCEIPFVAVTADFRENHLIELFRKGYSGICATSAIFNADDPVAEINRIVEILPTLKNA